MICVGKCIPRWVRFRKAHVKKPQFGPPTFVQWMVDRAVSRSVDRIMQSLAPEHSFFMGKMWEMDRESTKVAT